MPSDPSLSLDVLRALLLLMAFGETLGGFLQVFRMREMAALTGRRYSPDYHGAIQDFGLYNLTMAAFLCLAAWQPHQHQGVLWVVLALYWVHGSIHLLRAFGIYFAGETRIPNRPPRLEIRDGLTVLLPALGLLFFLT